MVALRKESVDRNGGLVSVVRFASTSLSARRAWIEMLDSTHQQELFRVALRKESVDRNNIGANNHVRVRQSRSPQGERG